MNTVKSLKGVYYEFIAVTCGRRYTMPLGVLMLEPPRFKVYRGTGLHSILRSGGASGLRLLSPLDPILYYESIEHRLEHNIRWDIDGCPVADDTLGAWFQCNPRMVEETMEYDVYQCQGFQHITGMTPPYSRVQGCLVELLVILTKAEAGVVEDNILDYARWLKWCVERASPVEEKYVVLSKRILRRIESSLREVE